MKSFFVLNKKRFAVIALVTVGVVLRFWRASELFHFMMDEERDALIFARVFKDGHVPLIGGSIPGGLYVGPIYTWISAIFLWIFQYDYSKLGFISALISGLSLPFLYLAVKKIFNERIAIFSLAIYSFSFLIVQFNRRYWPPTFAPSIFVFVLYAISIMNEKPRLSFWIIIVGLVFGLQSDPSNAATFLAVIIYMAFSLKEKIKAAKVFAFIVLSHLPLFVFELRHNFFLTKAILKFFTPSGGFATFHMFSFQKLITEAARTFSRILYIFGNRDLAVQFPPEPPLVALRAQIPLLFLFLAGALLLIGIVLIFRQKRRESSFIKIFFIVILIGISFYNYFFPGYTYEWFFTVSLPTFAILLGLFLSELKKEIAIFLIVVFSLNNINNNFFVGNSYAYSKKIHILKLAKPKVISESYSLISLGKTYVYSGYRYLANQEHMIPRKSYMDVYYEWLYPKASLAKHPAMILVVVNFSPFENITFWKKYQMFKKHEIASKSFYPLEAIIIDNRDGWFNKTKYDYFN